MKQHRAGSFAYGPVLDFARPYVIEGSRVLDIGSGFGNSAIYFACVCLAATVIPIEPLPEAVAVLKANLAHNRLDNVDASKLGLALAERPGQASLILPYTTHLGGARLAIADGGPVTVLRGDDVFGDVDFDFVFLDVNGGEVQVLSGLSGLIDRCRPVVCVAIAEQAKVRLDAFFAARGYRPGTAVDLEEGRHGFAIFEPRPVAEAAATPVPPGISHVRGVVSRFEVQGVPLCFFVNNRHDSIQAHHFEGRIYEAEELALIARHLPPSARILDCGANIGNHAVAFERLMGAHRIVLVEPNPSAIEMLRINVGLNRLKGCDLSHLGVALGATEGRCSIGTEPMDNLGGTRVVATDAGSCRMARGDDLFADERFDFIKIDVEGGEVDALVGLRTTISRDKPVLFVEVEDENRPSFNAFIAAIGYVPVETYDRYKGRTNVLAVPA
jgi:FkbM family methyltransferase